MAKPVKPLPATRFGLFLEAVAPWRNTLIVAGLLLALFIISRFEGLEDTEAAAIALVLPPVLLALAFLGMRDGPIALRVAGVAMLVLGGGFFLRQSWLVFSPPAALGHAELHEDDEAASIDLPEGVEAFELEVQGELLAANGDATGRYRLELHRGDTLRRIGGEMTRRVVATRVGRKGAGLTHVESQEVTRQPLILEDHGPLSIEVLSMNGLHDRLEISVLPAPLVGPSLWLVLGALVLLGLTLEAWAGWHALEARWTAALAVSGVLLHHLAYRFTADDPMHTVFGGLLFAGLTGGIGGWLVGVVVAHVTRSRALKGAARARR